MDSLKDNEVYISDSFADKYGIKPGDTIKLDAQYEKKTYKFKVKGTYDKSQSIAVFMPIEHFADTFDFADGRFSGFLSDTKIKDIVIAWIGFNIKFLDNFPFLLIQKVFRFGKLLRNDSCGKY